MKAAVYFCLGLFLFLLCGRSEARALRPSASAGTRTATTAQRLSPRTAFAAAFSAEMDTSTSSFFDLEDDEEDSHPDAFLLLGYSLGGFFGLLAARAGSRTRPTIRPNAPFLGGDARRYLALCSLRL
ncbi:hypothetical protein [Flaviaesturariibacter aridisoli]|uniref:Uncharacterized protein n=1 Tax=Flaviaesturariibacter aridisoli TaxID=2545761 RepID=A0A4R4E6N7_9BACT|nr:hypothetical protein [Flaviaesturariibacter aridisoli]TCZ73355.1 hypothetical protein E0486_06695 [Flaviaesturariibacter aridisoli]